MIGPFDRQPVITPEQRELLTVAQMIEALPLILKTVRTRRALTYRAAALEIGCGHTTLLRIEQGYGCHSDVAVLVFRWLGTV